MDLKSLALKIAKSPAVRKAALALLAAIAAAAGFSQLGCGTRAVAPKVARAIAVYECQLDAVKDLVPVAALAEEVVNAARSGNYPYATGLLLQLGMDLDDVKEVSEAFVACGAPEAPEPEPTPAGLIHTSW